MIDLHSHILPGVDDGPASYEGSLAMARAAVAAGTNVMVATPHIRSDYGGVEIGAISAGVEALNRALEQDGILMRVLPAGEVSVAKAGELADTSLNVLCLGSGSSILIETPYRAPDGDRSMEDTLIDLLGRGFRPVLAHPERCPLFQREPDRLTRLAELGVLCSMTAGSMSGSFGQPARRLALRLLADGLVHDVASDAHDAVHRSPDLLDGFRRAERDLPGILEQAPWYTVTAPVAIMAGRPLPARPDPPRLAASSWRRLARRGP